MIFREATTELTDAETVRQIRNSGRQWMTRDSAEITPEAQQAWWAQRDPATCRIWLARIGVTDVAYGLLRFEAARRGSVGDRWWCSLAVLPRYQGQGLGTQMYQHLALSTDQDVWAEILADNTASIRAAFRAGYRLAYALDRHAVLVHTK